MGKQEVITLHIDTSRSDSIRVGLEDASGRQVTKERDSTVAKAQEVLPMIEELLMKHEFRLDDVAAIQVNTGPGSYTGLRVGIAIANMLGFLLDVPINGIPAGSQAFPVYEGDRW